MVFLIVVLACTSDNTVFILNIFFISIERTKPAVVSPVVSADAVIPKHSNCPQDCILYILIQRIKTLGLRQEPLTWTKQFPSGKSKWTYPAGPDLLYDSQTLVQLDNNKTLIRSWNLTMLLKSTKNVKLIFCQSSVWWTSWLAHLLGSLATFL